VDPLAIVADGTNTYRVYVNGTQVNSAAITVRPASAGNRTFASATRVSPGETTTRPLDEFTLYNRGLARRRSGHRRCRPGGEVKEHLGNGILEPGEQCDDGTR